MLERRKVVMQCAAWPVAAFAAIYINSHMSDSSSRYSPEDFIPGMRKPSEIPLEEIPFDVIEANFRAYDAAYRMSQGEPAAG